MAMVTFVNPNDENDLITVDKSVLYAAAFILLERMIKIADRMGNNIQGMKSDLRAIGEEI